MNTVVPKSVRTLQHSFSLLLMKGNSQLCFQINHLYNWAGLPFFCPFGWTVLPQLKVEKVPAALDLWASLSSLHVNPEGEAQRTLEEQEAQIPHLHGQRISASSSCPFLSTAHQPPKLHSKI